jgi:glutamyl-tRNA reductase
MEKVVVDSFYSFAFTHRLIEVNKIGLLHIDPEDQKSKLFLLKEESNISELLFLSTCNRVEFMLVTSDEVNLAYIQNSLNKLYPNLSDIELKYFSANCELYVGQNAINHIFSVASSIDSMVLGEREIITQVRNAYELSRKNNLTGDFLRILIKHTIETAKRVYTETSIATKPVSVVSLAYHKLKSHRLDLNSRILIIGAGTTNSNLCRFLKKHGFKNFTVCNRTISKAKDLAKELSGSYLSLAELQSYNAGFDILLTCTASDHHLIGQNLYETMLNGEKDKKVVIDLAIPQDLNPEVLLKENLNYISIDVLQKESNDNLRERAKEIESVELILSEAINSFEYVLKERTVEIAMREVPQQIKNIKSTAINQVFKEEINSMDDHSKEVLEKILGYMEKKYISGPMKLAKDLLIQNS